jgi:hypothetical protein
LYDPTKGGWTDYADSARIKVHSENRWLTLTQNASDRPTGMSDRKSLMRRLRWMASGGGLVLFLGLLITVGNQAAGLVVALAGLLMLVGIAYFAYSIGKVEVPPTSGER